MYYTEMDPWSRKPVFVEKDQNRKQKQKDIVTAKGNEARKTNFSKRAY